MRLRRWWRSRASDSPVVPPTAWKWSAPTYSTGGPRRRYQAVLFAFWLSHVPPVRFKAFWELVAACLAPDGMAAFVDDGPDDAAFEEDADADPEVPTVSRRLPNPGREPDARYR